MGNKVLIPSSGYFRNWFHYVTSKAWLSGKIFEAPLLTKNLSITADILRPFNMIQKETVCDRHKHSVTGTEFMWHNYTDRHGLSVMDKDCLWRKQTICDRQRSFATNTYCIWQTQTFCDRKKSVSDGHRLSVTDTDCSRQTQTVCDRQNSPWQTQTQNFQHFQYDHD